MICGEKRRQKNKEQEFAISYVVSSADGGM
jgi:hypothetical protein